MIDKRIMVLAMVAPGEAPTPELVEAAKIAQHQARYADELCDAVDELTRTHTHNMSAPAIKIRVDAAIELLQKIAAPLKREGGGAPIA